MLFPPYRLHIRRNEPENDASLPCKSRKEELIKTNRQKLPVLASIHKHSMVAADLEISRSTEHRFPKKHSITKRVGELDATKQKEDLSSQLDSFR